MKSSIRSCSIASCASSTSMAIESSLSLVSPAIAGRKYRRWSARLLTRKSTRQRFRRTYKSCRVWVRIQQRSLISQSAALLPTSKTFCLIYSRRIKKNFDWQSTTNLTRLNIKRSTLSSYPISIKSKRITRLTFITWTDFFLSFTEIGMQQCRRRRFIFQKTSADTLWRNYSKMDLSFKIVARKRRLHCASTYCECWTYLLCLLELSDRSDGIDGLNNEDIFIRLDST